MDVETLCNTYQRKMWNSMISRKQLPFSIWDAILFKNEAVFYMPYSGYHKFAVTTRYCLKCNIELSIGFRQQEFIVHYCKCASDNKKYVTIEKLTTIFSYDQSNEIIKIFAEHKTRNLPNKLAHWTKLGYSDEEARTKITEIQRNRSEKSPATQPGTTNYSIRCADYWINKGYDECTARDKVAEIQITNGLEWYVSRYGHEDGRLKFNNRMRKWQKSYLTALQNDPTIAEKKAVALGRASKESLNVFLPIYKEYINQISMYLGIPDSQEYFLRDGTTLYFYDFTIPELKIIVEYNGSRFHPNETLLSTDELLAWRNPYSNASADVVIAKDNIKRKIAEHHGYTVITVWDTDDVIESQLKIKQVIEEKINEI